MRYRPDGFLQQCRKIGSPTAETLIVYILKGVKDMGNEGFYYNIRQAEKRNDVKRLAEIALTLVKCLPFAKRLEFEVLCSDQPDRVCFTGTNGECLAYVQGQMDAPMNDAGCFDRSVFCTCMSFIGKDSRVHKAVVYPENLCGVMIEDVTERLAK